MSKKDWAFGTVLKNRTETVVFVRWDRDAGYWNRNWFHGLRLDSKGPNTKVGVLGRYASSGFNVLEETK